MRVRRALSLLGASLLALGALVIAAPASAAVPGNPVIVSPEIQELIPTSSYVAEWQAVVGTNGPTQYEYEVSESSAIDGDGAFVTTEVSAVTSDLTAVIPALPDGSYYFHVRAGDDDGFTTWADAGLRVYLIDTTAPVITITSPLPVSGQSYELAFDLDEFTPTAWTVEIDGTEVASGDIPDFSDDKAVATTLGLSALAAGTHTLQITATDALGWVSEESVDFTVVALAATGAESHVPLYIGGLLLVTGVFLFVVRRFA